MYTKKPFNKVGMICILGTFNLSNKKLSWDGVVTCVFHRLHPSLDDSASGFFNRMISQKLQWFYQKIGHLLKKNQPWARISDQILLGTSYFVMSSHTTNQITNWCWCPFHHCTLQGEEFDSHKEEKEMCPALQGRHAYGMNLGHPTRTWSKPNPNPNPTQT